MKTCKICLREFPKNTDHFYPMGKWLDSYCKQCRCNATHERRKSLKKQAVEYMGGCCADCELVSEWVDVYDFHHLDPTQKDFGISKSSIKVLEKLKPELDKCVMLCANCHRIRHAILNIRND